MTAAIVSIIVAVSLAVCMFLGFCRLFQRADDKKLAEEME